MKTPRLQIYKTRKGLYRWRLRGGNGEIMCQGTSVKTAKACWYQLDMSVFYLGGHSYSDAIPYSLPRKGKRIEITDTEDPYIIVLVIERLA